MKNLLVLLLFLIFDTSTLFAQNKPVIEWVDIPAGTFVMGSPVTEKGREDNEAQHQVTLSAFKMSKYEVTFEQYDVFCEATGRKKPDDNGVRGNHPVVNVSWNDANDFAQWMGCRLPTEAEWEYSCRAGSTTIFNSGDCLSKAVANFGCGFSQIGCCTPTLPVGSLAPNVWGLYDMHGNVWEWCLDWYSTYPKTLQVNPAGPTTGTQRICRGGGWYWTEGDCRSAERNPLSPNELNYFMGFRLVAL